MGAYALAIDLGASSGRHILGRIENGKIVLREVYRFPNTTVERNGHLCWDVDANFGHVLAGLGQCKELGMNPEDYWWYCDLRRYGSCRHAGFGLGFERMVMYLTGVSNIRDVELHPRTVGNAEF